MEYIKHNLQLFADGGDGAGDGTGAEATSEITGADRIEASIPEKAKKYFQMAKNKTNSVPMESSNPKTDGEQPTTDGQGESKSEHIPFADLIKSDEYKDEHKAYMDKTIGDRLKKYKGMEEEYGKAREILDILAGKYGITHDDANFLDTLRTKAEADDSFYEQYAIDHDMSTDDARKLVTMERKVAQMQERERLQQQIAEQQQATMRINQMIEETKAKYPNFNMDVEWGNEAFQRLTRAGVPILTAYETIHKDEIIQSQVRMLGQQMASQTAQAVASNKSRPVENGISNQAASTSQIDFSKMTLAQLRDYASQQKRNIRR